MSAIARVTALIGWTLLGPGPAVAAESAAVDPFPLPLDRVPAAEAGKSRPFAVMPAPPPPSGCAAALDCRLRLIGAIERNGAVELNATLFKW